MKTLITPNNLTDAQLLSMIMGGKNALPKSEFILKNITLDKILETQPEELRFFYNLTDKQVQNIENFKSFRKRALIKRDLLQIRNSSDGKDLILPYMSDLDHEEFFCIFLYRANKILKIGEISKGGISGTVTDIRLIFKSAILLTASGLIVAHNHPSGNLNPQNPMLRLPQRSGKLVTSWIFSYLII
jgi:DNA repair protein RadC